MFSCRYCEIFKNTYFEEHLRTAASRMWEENPHSPCFVLPMFFRFLRRKKSIWVNPVCLSFHKTYIKLQFYFPLWLMFKYFAIHVFFTPAWDFTSVFLTGVKSDRREISLCLECVTTLGLYVETEVSSIPFTADCLSKIIHITTPLILTPK